ncbi:hypothetical protein VP01_521g7, partial [Puccinia sorghi]
GSRQTGRLSDGCPQNQKAIDKGAKLPATSLQEITSTKQKSLIKKLSITSYLCGFCVKQSHGPVLKTHIFEQPFTTMKDVSNQEMNVIN